MEWDKANVGQWFPRLHRWLVELGGLHHEFPVYCNHFPEDHCLCKGTNPLRSQSFLYINLIWYFKLLFVHEHEFMSCVMFKIMGLWILLQYSVQKPRSNWEMGHPTLVAESLFAIANIFSSLRLICLFTVNSHLGPLQISLGRMLLDILKFFFIYWLVLLAFANGLNQLYFYYETEGSNNCKGIRCNQQNNAFST